MQLDLDMNSSEMKAWAKTKKASYTRSALYDDQVWKSPGQSGDTEQEHCVTWLEAQDGARTAKSVYNHLNCAALALWIAEAAGVNGSAVEEAYHAAELSFSDKGSASSAAAAVRRIIPWTMVVEASQPNQ